MPHFLESSMPARLWREGGGRGRSQEALSEQRWGPPHSCLRVTGADTEAAHEQLSRFLQHVPNLALPLLHQLLICLRATFLLGPGWPEDSCTHDWSHVWLPSWWPRQPRHSASVLWCRQSHPVGHFLLVTALPDIDSWGCRFPRIGLLQLSFTQGSAGRNQGTRSGPGRSLEAQLGGAGHHWRQTSVMPSMGCLTHRVWQCRGKDIYTLSVFLSGF